MSPEPSHCLPQRHLQPLIVNDHIDALAKMGWRAHVGQVVGHLLGGVDGVVGQYETPWRQGMRRRLDQVEVDGFPRIPRAVGVQV